MVVVVGMGEPMLEIAPLMIEDVAQHAEAEPARPGRCFPARRFADQVAHGGRAVDEAATFDKIVEGDGDVVVQADGDPLHGDVPSPM